MLSWPCAPGHCLIRRWTFGPVWGPEPSGLGFHQYSAPFSPPQPWPVSLSQPKAPPQGDVAPTRLCSSDATGQAMSSTCFLLLWCLELRPKSSMLLISEQEILFFFLLMIPYKDSAHYYRVKNDGVMERRLPEWPFFHPDGGHCTRRNSPCTKVCPRSTIQPRGSGGRSFHSHSAQLTEWTTGKLQSGFRNSSHDHA